jgi:hypothetical protein
MMCANPGGDVKHLVVLMACIMVATMAYAQGVDNINEFDDEGDSCATAVTHERMVGIIQAHLREVEEALGSIKKATDGLRADLDAVISAQDRDSSETVGAINDALIMFMLEYDRLSRQLPILQDRIKALNKLDREDALVDIEDYEAECRRHSKEELKVFTSVSLMIARSNSKLKKELAEASPEAKR